MFILAAIVGTEKTVLVEVETPASTTGVLRRFEDGRAVGAPIPIVVGTKGIALGDTKREGDLRTPAGKFRVTGAVGYDADVVSVLPYTRATRTLRCVDDPRSKHYNTLVDERAVKKDWSSAEMMRRDDELYRRVLTIDYNTRPVRAGKGSCIFLHIWESASTPTAGCIAMSAADLETLLRWADTDTALAITARRR